MLFQYLHKMRRKITKKNPYMQEQNACHVIFPVILADSLFLIFAKRQFVLRRDMIDCLIATDHRVSQALLDVCTRWLIQFSE